MTTFRKIIKLVLTVTIVFAGRLLAQSPLDVLQVIHIGGESEDERIIGLEVDDEGNTYVACNVSSDYLYFNDSLISQKKISVLLKLDTNGEIIYQYEFTCENPDHNIFIQGMTLSPNNDIYISGGLFGTTVFGDTTVSTGDSGEGFIAKFVNDIPSHIHLLDYSTGSISVRSFQVDEFNAIYMAAISNDEIYEFPGIETINTTGEKRRMPIFKLNENFSVEWAKVYYSESYDLISFATALDQNNNFLATTNYSSDTLLEGENIYQLGNGSHFLLLKSSFDEGNLQWMETIDSDHSFSHNQCDVCFDSENNLFVTTAYSTNDNNIMYKGETIINPSNNGNQATLICSINENSDLVWFKHINITGSLVSGSFPQKLRYRDNSLYLLGQYQKPAYFDDFLLPSISSGYTSSDVYFTKIDKTNGEYIWVQGLYGHDLGYNRYGFFDFSIGNNIVTSAYFMDSGNIGDFFLESYGNTDIYLATLYEDPMVDIEENTIEENYFIYPNPGNNKLAFKGNKELVSVELYNTIGNLVLKENHLNNNTLLDTSSLPSGIYIYKLEFKNNSSFSGKWVKE